MAQLHCYVPEEIADRAQRRADHYGQIHADLLNQGKPIGPNDTLIAAIGFARPLRGAIRKKMNND